MTAKRERRWLLASIIIVVVIIASVGIVLKYRDSPGSIPVIAVSDGSGGTIIAWQNGQGVLAQRINASGELLWKEGGIPVSEAGADAPDPYAPIQTHFTLIADGTGGAIITWDDTSGRPTDWDDPAYFDPIPFHSQRISSSGEFLWQNTIIASGDAGLCGGGFPIVIADGTGGAIFAWNNYKTYFRALHDDSLRVQRIAPDGARLWGNEGVLLVSSSPYRPLTEEEKAAGIKGTIHRSWPTYAGRHDIVSDGTGGAIVVWEEEGEQTSRHTYAQRVDSNGNLAWRDKVTVAAWKLQSAESDGSGGAIVKTPDGDVYSGIGKTGVPMIVHVSSNGELLETRIYVPGVVTMSDGVGGSFIIRVEEDPPYGPPAERLYTPYIKRLDGSGQPLWPEKRPLPEYGEPYGNVKYLADGTGGVIITWGFQKESIAYSNARARRLDASGDLKWGEEGTPVFDLPGIRFQKVSEVLSDGSGGAIITAVTGRSAFSGDMVHAQRLDINGNRLWGGGVRIDR